MIEQKSLKDSSIKKEQLIEQIQHVYETDVGDFKRKTVLYLNRFLESQDSLALKKKVQDIKNFILYKELSSSREMEDIESLRFALLKKLKTL